MAVDLGGLLGGAVAGYGLYDQYKALEDAGTDYQAAVQPIMQQAGENLQFRPYTVTSNIGGTSFSPEGAMQYNIGAPQQAISNQAFGGTQQLFGQALAPQDQRVQDVYNQIRATQRPMEQEDRLALEERMAAQGRLGLQSAQYGGTSPELMAQERALAESRNAASLAAIQQAQAEQQQAYNIGTGMLGAGYTPYAQINDMATQGYNYSNLANQNQRTYADLMTQLGLGGVQANQAAEANRQNLLGQIYSLGAGMLGGTRNPITGDMEAGVLNSAANSIGNSIGGWFGSLFGGGNQPSSILPTYSTPITGGINNINSSLNSAGNNLSVPTMIGTNTYPSALDFMPSNLGNVSTIGNFNYDPNGAGLSTI